MQANNKVNFVDALFRFDILVTPNWELNTQFKENHNSHVCNDNFPIFGGWFWILKQSVEQHGKR
jgi:hypothetical protein